MNPNLTLAELMKNLADGSRVEDRFALGLVAEEWQPPALNEAVRMCSPGEVRYVWQISVPPVTDGADPSWETLPEVLVFPMEREFARWSVP